MGPVARVVTAKVDPVSGQPEMKATPVRVAAVAACFHGVLLRRHGGVLGALCHWVRVPVAAGQLYRLAGLVPLPRGPALARFAAALLDLPDGCELQEMSDAGRGVLRIAAIRDGALQACLFLARDAAALPDEAALLPMLGAPVPDQVRRGLLAGRLRDAAAAHGPKICACFSVSGDAIRLAAVTHQLGSAKQVGAMLRAGTNCGSCLPEIEEILRDVRIPAA